MDVCASLRINWYTYLYCVEHVYIFSRFMLNLLVSKLVSFVIYGLNKLFYHACVVMDSDIRRYLLISDNYLLIRTSDLIITMMWLLKTTIENKILFEHFHVLYQIDNPIDGSKKPINSFIVKAPQISAYHKPLTNWLLICAFLKTTCRVWGVIKGSRICISERWKKMIISILYFEMWRLACVSCYSAVGRVRILWELQCMDMSNVQSVRKWIIGINQPHISSKLLRFIHCTMAAKSSPSVTVNGHVYIPTFVLARRLDNFL